MSKLTFIKELKNVLNNKDFEPSVVNEVIEDYTILIDEAIERGEDEAQFITRLGTPKQIAKTLQKDQPNVIKVDNRFIAISPFIALIIFFYLGFAHNAWHPGWLAFLLIPITAITLETKGLERFVALSVFISLIGFMLFGTYMHLWHPMWALFLAIPGLGFLTSKTHLQKAFGLYTLFAAALFIFIVLMFEPAGYYHFLILVPIPIMGLLSGQIEIIYFTDTRLSSLLWSLFIVIGLILIYVFIGLNYDLWHPTWLMFLILPVGALLYTQFIKKENVEVVAYTPFIALTIFFLWGEYGNAYHYSWLIFLIIPITAILFEKKT